MKSDRGNEPPVRTNRELPQYLLRHPLPRVEGLLQILLPVGVSVGLFGLGGALGKFVPVIVFHLRSEIRLDVLGLAQRIGDVFLYLKE